MRWTPILCVLLVGAALAGCAVNESTDNNNTTTTTPVTTTPRATTPATTTPATPGGNGSGNASTPTLRVVAMQSGPPGNGTTYSFQAPVSVPSGWVKLVLENRAPEPHQALVIEAGNRSVAQLEGLLFANATGNASMEEDEPRPMGGVGGVLGNATATAWLRLEPGRYVIACFIPDPVTGMPHAAHGMMRELNVTSATTPGVAPQADFRLRLLDYGFSPEKNLTAGKHMVEVRNEGKHHHEAVYFRLAPNTTVEQVLASFEPGATGPPPILSLGGVAPMEVGAVQYFEVDFAPGHYVFLCFEQEEDEPAPHFAMGMRWEFNVTG